MQPRHVISDRPDFSIRHFQRNGAHDLGGIVSARAIAEGFELGFSVIGALAAHARVLRRDAGARGAVA